MHFSFFLFLNARKKKSAKRKKKHAQAVSFGGVNRLRNVLLEHWLSRLISTKHRIKSVLFLSL